MSRFRLPASRRALPGLLAVLLCSLLMGYYPQRPSEHPPFFGDVSVLQPDLETRELSAMIGGKKTVIFYFLPTCPHCQQAAPAIVKLARKYSSQIQFLGIASARSRLSEMREFQEGFQIPFPVVQDGGSFGTRNQLRSYPAFIFTDGSPTPAERYMSYSPDMDSLLEVALVRYLGQNPLPLLKPDSYYGSMVCSACHIGEFRSWGLNHHAIAINSLFQIKKEADPKCVGCHVVAYGKPGGYKDMESTPGLANVGCEACHGPAGGHNAQVSVEERLARAKLTPEQRYGAVCASCHDAEHTIGFDVKKGIPLVGHHLDRTLTEVDWLARRSKLAAGEADRPLLEFPPGEIQGAAVCMSCHKELHSGWQQDPHGRAMDVLTKQGKDKDVSCVKCHAVLKDTRRPDAVDAYLPGVQCESCHGAGEAHVKAGGGKGNIVALTKSCPVCVIEALCSSCHTREQDPDFELEPALKRVKHLHTTH